MQMHMSVYEKKCDIIDIYYLTQIIKLSYSTQPLIQLQILILYHHIHTFIISLLNRDLIAKKY